MMGVTTGKSIFIKKLNRLDTLSYDDCDALTALTFKVEQFQANRYLIREGDIVSRCFLILDGYACRHKVSRTGQRQIVAFHMAGDLLDLQHCLLPRADHNVQTVTAATVGWVMTDELKALAYKRPKVAEAFARDAFIDASVFREWVVNLGTRDAKARVAHMLCEFIARREASGNSPVETIELPFTQEQIGDATGMTSVHVNRMLRALTEEGAFEREGRVYKISNWPKLKAIATFDPSYLHHAFGLEELNGYS